MFDFEVFLKELILKNRRVIIPEVGSFLHKEGAETKLVFSSFLRYNDGFLEESMQTARGISSEESSQFVKNLAESIVSSLQNGLRYYISDLGYFVYDAKRIQFVFGNHNIEPTTFDDDNVFSNKSYRNNKSFGSILKRLAACLLPIFLIFYFNKYVFNVSDNDLLYETLAKTSNVVEVDAVNVSVSRADVEIEKPTINLRAKSSVIERKSSTTGSGYSNYHIIVGCFAAKPNAERLVRQCRENGYATAEILPDKIGDLYPVSIEKYPAKSDAEKKKNEYNSKFEKDAWIYKTF